MEQEFKDLRELLLIAAICKKPEQAEFEKLLAPLLKDIEGISRANEVGRKDRDWVSHFSTVSTAAPCVGWVTIVGRPPPNALCTVLTHGIAVPETRALRGRPQRIGGVLL